MAKQIRRILKSSDVKMQGSFRLELPKQKASPSAAAQVRVLENNPQFAVLQITCACGEKTNVRCEYTDGTTTPQTPRQNPVPQQNK